MEQFSLEKYLANPSRKVVTRDGRPVRILCTDRKDLDFPIIALIETSPGQEMAYTYPKDGKHCTDYTDIFNLFFAPEPHEGWINIYRDSDNGRVYTGRLYDSKEDAEKRKSDEYITTIKIKWEE